MDRDQLIRETFSRRENQTSERERWLREEFSLRRGLELGGHAATSMESDEASRKDAVARCGEDFETQSFGRRGVSHTRKKRTYRERIRGARRVLVGGSD